MSSIFVPGRSPMYVSARSTVCALLACRQSPRDSGTLAAHLGAPSRDSFPRSPAARTSPRRSPRCLIELRAVVGAAIRAIAPPARRTPRRSGHSAARADTRRSSRPPRPSRRARPPSIDMLHTVMRSSIESASTAAPRYSITCPVAPSVPICPMMPRIKSFAVTPAPQPSIDANLHRLRLGSATGTASPARARLRWCRCRTRARRTRRAWRYGCRRRRSSCPAA